MIDKIDDYMKYMAEHHKNIFRIMIAIVFVLIIIFSIPIAILFILISALHDSFYTGCIYRKDENGKPKKTWI